MKKIALVCLLVLLPVAAFAHHHEEAAPVRQLDPLAGNWRCSGTAFASPMAPQHATSGEVSMQWDLDGHWLPFTYAEKKTADNPMPFMVRGYFGFDPQMNKLVLFGVENSGGYSVASSDGWNGDTLAFVGPWHMGKETMNGRDTFTRKGDRELRHSAEIEQDGKWVKLSDESCTRK